MTEPWKSVSTQWRGNRNDEHWTTSWPRGLCKECGKEFQVVAGGRYWWCSDRCKRKAHNRSGNHAGRIRRLARKQSLPWPPYEIVGRFELYDAYQGRCGYCGRNVDFAENWIFGHIAGVAEGGSHVRENLAVVHQSCEWEWNAALRSTPS